MATSTSPAQNKSVIIKWIISIALAAAPLLISTGEMYTVQAQRFLAITILGIAILAFELMSSFGVAIMLPSLWVITGVTNLPTAFSAWSSSNSLTVLGALFLSVVLDQTGLLKRLGYWCLIKAKGSFVSTMWALFIAILLINAVGFVMTAVLGFTFAYALYKVLELKPSDKESQVLVMTTMLAGIQSATFLYCPITVTIMNGAISAAWEGHTIYWYQLIRDNVPTLLFCVIMMAAMLFWYKRSTKGQSISTDKGLEYFKKAYADLGKMSTQEKKGIAILLGLMIYLMTQPLHGLDSTYAFLIVTFVYFIPGVSLANSETVKTINWESWFTIGCFLGVGTVAASTGINTILANAMVPLVSSMGEYWSVLGSLIFGTLVNFVISPFAMLAMLPGPIISYCLQAGFDPMPHIYAMYQAKDILFFPYEYPQYLILFSFGMVKMGSMIKLCTIKSLGFILFFIAIMMPLWRLVGIM